MTHTNSYKQRRVTHDEAAHTTSYTYGDSNNYLRITMPDAMAENPKGFLIEHFMNVRFATRLAAFMTVWPLGYYTTIKVAKNWFTPRWYVKLPLCYLWAYGSLMLVNSYPKNTLFNEYIKTMNPNKNGSLFLSSGAAKNMDKEKAE